MARIRSIKPEFWKDGKVKRLTPACALFFIGLWNFCDDEGKARTDSLELSLNLPSFRSQDIVKHIRTLAEAGLVRLSHDAEWLLVENWEHQKIDRPRKPKISKSELQWLEVSRKDYSSNALRALVDKSPKDRRKDRIGKDRRGEDRISIPTGAPPAVESGFNSLGPDSSETPRGESPTKETWEAYSVAYESRHGAAPVRNATTNSQMAAFVKRIGGAEAPQVAAFYVSHNDQFYVRSLHSVGLLLQNAEKLRTEWATGRRVTGTVARQAEKSSHAQDQLARIARGEL